MFFMNLLGEMSTTVNDCKRKAAIAGLADDVQNSVNTLAEMAMYFAGSAKAGKYLIPISNAYPFLMLN